MSAIVDITSATAIVISVIAILLSQIRKSTTDTKTLENRLTKIEQNQITPEERRCIIENNMMVKLISNVIEKDFSRILKEPTTLDLDNLFDKVEKTGFKSLTGEELVALLEGVNIEFDKAITERKEARASLLSFYRSAAQLMQTGFDDACNKVVNKIADATEAQETTKKHRFIHF